MALRIIPRRRFGWTLSFNPRYARARVEQEKGFSGDEPLVRQMDVVDRVMAERSGEGFSRNSLKVILCIGGSRGR